MRDNKPGLEQPNFDQEFLDAHNEMRTNPMSFIPDLEKMLEEYGDNMYRPVKING
jgi:hypothetical protein